MSSFIRRIQREQVPSRKIHRDKDGNLYANPRREVFHLGRGSRLGVHNLYDKSLLARVRREHRRAA